MRTIIEIDETARLDNGPEWLRQKIRDAMTLPNPKFTEAQKHGRYCGHLEPELKFYDSYGGTITFLRGYARQVAATLMAAGVAFDVDDKRRELEPLPLMFKGTLREYQAAAVDAALVRDHGTIEAPTGSGKTIIALAMIARRRQPSLVLVHTNELLHQWCDRIKMFLGIDPGKVGAGKLDIKPVTVAMVQTARKHINDLPRHFGNLVVDECHRTPSTTFQDVVSGFDSKYMLGLSATAYRRDGLTRLIYLTLGDRVHRVEPELLRKNGAVLVPEIVTRETDFCYPYADDYQAMLSALVEGPERNRMIACDIRRNVNGGTALVVSDRVDHLHTLSGLVNLPHTEILTGSTPARERARIVEAVNAGALTVLFTTVQLLGEGFDCEGLTDLYLATPIKYKGRVIQTAGRILRPAPGKVARIFDYVDVEQPVLAAQARTRAKALSEIAGDKKFPICFQSVSNVSGI